MAFPPQSRVQRERRAQLLEGLLRVQRETLIRQARFHSRRSEDAEDALSDACVQFLRFFDAGSGRDPLPWMQVVVKRCAWAIGRRRALREGREVHLAAEQAGEKPAAQIRDQRLGPGELAERGAETAQVLALIEGLKPDERAALTLFGLGCSYAEIAELRGWTMTKVNRCISEGRAAVRESLGRGDS